MEIKLWLSRAEEKTRRRPIVLIFHPLFSTHTHFLSPLSLVLIAQTEIHIAHGSTAYLFHGLVRQLDRIVPTRKEKERKRCVFTVPSIASAISGKRGDGGHWRTITHTHTEREERERERGEKEKKNKRSCQEEAPNE
jgi:hypothetical protein